MTAFATPDDVRRFPYLAPLSDAEAETLAARLPRLRFPARECLLVQGGPVQGIVLVVAGRARLFMTNAEGKEQTLRIVSAGDTFAEVPVLDGAPSPVTVEAMEPLEVVVLPGAQLRAVMAANPVVAELVLLHFARRLRALTEMIEQVSLQSVTARLARYLYQMAVVEGAPAAEGIVVRREVTIHDLATVVGSVREVVTRYLKQFEADGVLTMTRRDFIIHDIPALKRLL